MDISRIPHGRPVINYQGYDIVAADAIALMSGVNFGSIEKVLATIQAIADFTGTYPETLIEVDNIPQLRVRPDDSRTADRAEATLAFCQALAADEEYRELEPLLNLRGRFLKRELQSGE